MHIEISSLDYYVWRRLSQQKTYRNYQRLNDWLRKELWSETLLFSLLRLAIGCLFASENTSNHPMGSNLGDVPLFFQWRCPMNWSILFSSPPPRLTMQDVGSSRTQRPKDWQREGTVPGTVENWWRNAGFTIQPYGVWREIFTVTFLGEISPRSIHVGMSESGDMAITGWWF